MESCGIFIVAKLSAKNVLQSNLMHLVSGVANDQLNSNRELLSTSLFFTSTSWNMIENKDENDDLCPWVLQDCRLRLIYFADNSNVTVAAQKAMQ